MARSLMFWSVSYRSISLFICENIYRPMIRKTYHKKSSADTIRETMKVDAEEVRNNKSHMGETDSNGWVPHERTGIYYPKGQEKVMEGIPPAAGKDVDVVNWFSHHGEY
ncbi:uncharacterized protein LOC133695931 [Populus nigra]|uniref:uncharacterized protein LOC133695931 n=1 Tax=Populus nigra TaxID=3691 RepID=UPI002B279032|nr:uncharacterized protein LOC133695931 [Populus nigra]